MNLLEKVERLIQSEIPDAEITHNQEAGTIVISEWPGDLDPPTYVIPEHGALEFARWLREKRHALVREAAKEAMRLTTPDDKKRIRKAYRAWRERHSAVKNPAADARAPGGKHTYKDMIAALHAVQNADSRNGRAECFRILTVHGEGAKNVRELRPEFYDAVTQAATLHTATAQGTA